MPAHRGWESPWGCQCMKRGEPRRLRWRIATDRITSYNVCYTKLLRGYVHPNEDGHGRHEGEDGLEQPGEDVVDSLPQTSRIIDDACEQLPFGLPLMKRQGLVKNVPEEIGPESVEDAVAQAHLSYNFV